MLSNTFAGIKPSSAPGFMIFELVGLVLAVAAIRVLYPDIDDTAETVVVPIAQEHIAPVRHADAEVH